MIRILTVIGARPQFIKAAVVSREIASTEGVGELLVHTGQHYDDNMSDVFFDEMGIPAPAYHLDVSGGSHGRMTGRMLERIESVLQTEKPDLVLVYGDTNSTLAGALASAKMHIPVAHVEAGLRSFNKRMPEETNRILTDHCAKYLFSPTATATQNLMHEGIDAARIFECGDVMFDAARYFGRRAEVAGRGAPRFGLSSKGYVLATVHRQENTDDPVRLKEIFEGLADVAADLPVVIPLHPRTRERLSGAGLEAAVSALTVIDPVGYLDMVGLEKEAAVIATDSGGVQKEAFFHRVPCVTLRRETEWGELVEAGWNRLVEPENRRAVRSAIVGAIGTAGLPVEPYGQGAAATLICDALVERLNG